MKTPLERKKEQLGMNPSTAYGRLKKLLLFSMAKELGRTTCYRCGALITDIKDFTIEHKEPWLDGDDPSGLFFDLSNVAFSHLSCNIADARKNTDPCIAGHAIAARKLLRPKNEHGQYLCSRCKVWKDTSDYTRDASSASGYRAECKDCRKLIR